MNNSWIPEEQEMMIAQHAAYQAEKKEKREWEKHLRLIQRVHSKVKTDVSFNNLYYNDYEC